MDDAHSVTEGSYSGRWIDRTKRKHRYRTELDSHLVFRFWIIDVFLDRCIFSLHSSAKYLLHFYIMASFAFIICDICISHWVGAWDFLL